MARRPRPWFRRDTGWWMVTLNGRQHKLVEGRDNRDLAEQEFHKLMLVRAQPAGDPDTTVASLCDAYLVWCEGHRSSETYRQHEFYLQQLAEGCGYRRVADLKPYHVQAWLNSKTSWNSTTRFNAVRIAKRVMNWAIKDGRLEKTPLQHLERPRPERRQRGITDDENRALYRAASIPFKRFLLALWHTGARPGEICRLQWCDVQATRWVLTQHKTAHKTKRPRVIVLSRQMQRLMRAMRNAGGRDGSVFLNCRQQPWTRDAVRQQFARLRKQLGLADDLCAYHFRHSFATRALRNGVTAATVAALLGHSSTEMVMSVYGHLVDEHDHVLAAVDQVNARPSQK